MALRVVFFGNSNSVFSLRFFQALPEGGVELVGIVDSPRRKRGSTNPLPDGLHGFHEATQDSRACAFEPDSPNEPEFVQAMARLSPDLFIAAGYTNLLKEPILSVPRIFAVNFHASLLPAYRGKHPVFWCLRQGERYSGLTAHVMDPAVDAGDILYQVRVRTYKNDTVESLYERILERSTSLVPRLIQECLAGAVRRTPQPQEGASYFSSIGEEDYRIDWSLPAETIRRRITITPGRCFVEPGEDRLHLADASVVRHLRKAPPGTILRIGSRRCIVAASDHGVLLKRGRLGEGPEEPIAGCLHALGLKEGDSL